VYAVHICTAIFVEVEDLYEILFAYFDKNAMFLMNLPFWQILQLDEKTRYSFYRIFCLFMRSSLQAGSLRYEIDNVHVDAF
jgi:hypothetical protein